jgi:Tfp pilus assembly protein PilF
VEYVPNQPALYYYLGVAQYLNNMNEEAISSLKLGAGNIDSETSKKVSSDIYLMLGDIYHKIGDKESAYNAYDSCLVYDPNRVLCLNNYAYFLSLDKRELEKAERMSLAAITAEPDNGTYLDTYAWVLYQEGRYEEAKKYIDMAMESIEKRHRELLDEAGDNREEVEKACQEEKAELEEHLKAINEKLKK